MLKNHTEIYEKLQATHEYQTLINVGLIDVSTSSNIKRGSIYFRTCISNDSKSSSFHPPEIKEKPFYEYIIYLTGYIRVYNPKTQRFGNIFHINDFSKKDETEIIAMYILLLKEVYKIYMRKAKKEGLLKELDEMNNIAQHLLPLHIDHKWKFGQTHAKFIERLKTINRNRETVDTI